MTLLTYADVSLESGDRLTRREFHRRYCAHPNIKKAELIEGVVYVPSPVRADSQGRPQLEMAGWLYAYAATMDEVDYADNATVILDDRNEPRPDLCLLWIDPHRDGARVNDE